MNEYEKQAKDFLLATNTTLEMVKAVPQKAPLWTKKGEKHGINYVVTLKNDRATYSFDFWNSIHNAELINAINNLARFSFEEDQAHYQAERILRSSGYKVFRMNKEQKEKEIAKLAPSEYNILACLSPLYEDTLEDFCQAFGYDEDSILAEKTFQAVKEQDRMLRKLFNDSQLELLANMN